MILAAGMTPAWQQILQFDRFDVGEVNRTFAAHWCASGKVLNVALALHHLNAECMTLSFVGGDTGSAIQREFETHGISAEWIQTDCPTRVCTTILDQSTKKTTELVENASSVSAMELRLFEGAFHKAREKADIALIVGSMTSGTPADYYQRLLTGYQGKAILDARGPELEACLPLEPFVVKPNREELGKTIGAALDTDEALVDAMKRLNRSGAQWVIVTQGSQWVWVSSADTLVRFKPCPAEVVNPIGCGDCFAAGLATALDQNLSVHEAVKWGIAAAAENLGQLLPARLNVDAVKARLSSIRVETL